MSWSICLVACLTIGADHFEIKVVDQETGRGVPLVELRTVNDIRHFTDSNGIVAFREPGLMDQSVYFSVSSHGYEFPADGFGFRGKRLKVAPGGKAVIKIQRINVAQRLYRMTGAGIYRDSSLTGNPVPTKRPLLNGLVTGSDSVVNTIYRDRVYWFWGDTNRPSYPLGNFHVPGATSRLPNDGGLDPEVGVDLTYFVDPNGFARPMAQMPGKGPTWINGLMVVPDEDGRDRMLAMYVKVAKPMRVYQRGLVEYDDDAERFEHCIEFPLKATAIPGGHPFRHQPNGSGREYVYFANPYPLVRVPANRAAAVDLKQYESFTCVESFGEDGNVEFDRDASGNLRYCWRAGLPKLDAKRMKQWIQRERIGGEQSLFQLRDVETGKPFIAHGGSVYWNAYRNRWVMIVLESYGTSLLGEVWYAESPTPVGPWIYARKIVTHQEYSFYNPKQHPMFDKNGGKTIFFEGTYTNMFSGNPDRTPRYNYNQVMYQLDLSDTRLVLPVPVYELDGRLSTAPPSNYQGAADNVSFLAADRPMAGTIAIYGRTDPDGNYVLSLEKTSGATRDPLFFGLPAETESATEVTAPLFAYRHETTGQRIYRLAGGAAPAGYGRRDKPICRVWRNPAKYTTR